jgi:TRAP-type C4-dicarboxylate transport system substrate-binding protein
VAGLRFRTAPNDLLAVDVITALGGKTQVINYSDIYNALQQGVVDGQDNPLINVQTARFYKVQKFISLTGHKVTIYAFLMSKLVWDGLSAADREIVLAAAKDATRYQRELARNADEEAVRDLVAHGVRIDKVDTRPFVAATASIYDKWYASPIGDYVRAVVKAARGKQ